MDRLRDRVILINGTTGIAAATAVRCHERLTGGGADHGPRLPLHRDHPQRRQQAEPAGGGTAPHGHARPSDRGRGQRGAFIRFESGTIGQFSCAPGSRCSAPRTAEPGTSPRRRRARPAGCSPSATRSRSSAMSTCSATCSAPSTKASRRGRRRTTATSSTRTTARSSPSAKPSADGRHKLILEDPTSGDFTERVVAGG